MARIISIVGWKKFQHYKDRDPPWVKLYRDTLTTETWVLGTDISRLVQLASVLLAARYSNQIPYLWDLIRKVSHLGCSEHEFNDAVAHLVSGKFLEIHEVTDSLAPSVASCSQHASNTIAKCSSEERRAEQSRGEQTRAREAVDESRPPERDRSEPGTDPPAVPTAAGAVCLAMKSKGVMDVTPSFPKLLALLAEGADIAEFVQAAKDSVAKGNPKFAYALAVVEGRRRDAAQGKPTGLQGPLVRTEPRRPMLPDAMDVVRARDAGNGPPASDEVARAAIERMRANLRGGN